MGRLLGHVVWLLWKWFIHSPLSFPATSPRPPDRRPISDAGRSVILKITCVTSFLEQQSFSFELDKVHWCVYKLINYLVQKIWLWLRAYPRWTVLWWNSTVNAAQSNRLTGKTDGGSSASSHCRLNAYWNKGFYWNCTFLLYFNWNWLRELFECVRYGCIIGYLWYMLVLIYSLCVSS